MKRIYLDYASLTPIDKGVMKVIKKYSTEDYTNPSSFYTSGIKSAHAILQARIDIAKVIHAHHYEILFTSGGTESNDIVFRAFAGKKIFISAVEHSSINKYANAIKIPVDQKGQIDLEFLGKNLTIDTGLVSVMMVNNEIGVIEPIREIAKIVRDFNKKNNTHILFHTDASQAGYLPLHLEKLGIDLMTLDGQKIYGPRGVGMLYVRRETVEDIVDIERAGTENTPAIIGFSYALTLLEKMREKEVVRIGELKNFFFTELQKINKEIKLNGSLENSSPHILNVSIPNIHSEFFILQLDAKGIECSTKSACLRDSDESYVLRAIGASSKNSVRFSFGRGTSNGDLKKVLKVISRILTT